MHNRTSVLSVVVGVLLAGSFPAFGFQRWVQYEDTEKHYYDCSSDGSCKHAAQDTASADPSARLSLGFIERHQIPPPDRVDVAFQWFGDSESDAKIVVYNQQGHVIDRLPLDPSWPFMIGGYRLDERPEEEADVFQYQAGIKHWYYDCWKGVCRHEEENLVPANKWDRFFLGTVKREDIPEGDQVMFETKKLENGNTLVEVMNEHGTVIDRYEREGPPWDAGPQEVFFNDNGLIVNNSGRDLSESDLREYATNAVVWFYPNLEVQRLSRSPPATEPELFGAMVIYESSQEPWAVQPFVLNHAFWESEVQTIPAGNKWNAVAPLILAAVAVVLFLASANLFRRLQEAGYI